MINKIWAFFIIVGVSYAILSNNMAVINKEILRGAKIALEMFVNILPIITLWVGIITIAKESGLLDKLTLFLSPLLSFLFPEIPKNHESLGFIASNIVINMFGLGNAATPFGLKAMKSLQELNKEKDTASRSMITFLVMNTSGVALIPTTVIAIRMMYHSNNPTEIVLPVIIATLCGTTLGLILDRLIWKLKRHKNEIN